MSSFGQPLHRFEPQKMIGETMKFSAFRMLCRLLVVSLLALPFPAVHAGMIGTQDAVLAAGAQADRDAVLSVLNRSDVASQMQSQGLDPSVAKARVASMTDQEVSALAGQLDSLPAGAKTSGWAVAVVIAIIVWWVYFK
jgi:hypothetical protein